MQQYKLFPHIATCFAIKVTFAYVWNMYITVQGQLHQDDFEKLPEVAVFLLIYSFLHLHVFGFINFFFF